MRARQNNIRVFVALCAVAVIVSAVGCRPAYASRGIRTDYPFLTPVAPYTATSFTWTDTGGALTLSFAPGTSLTHGCEWESSEPNSQYAPLNYDMVYMFNWFPDNGLSCGAEPQKDLQEQVLIYEVENEANVGFAVDFNYMSTNCANETATFTEDGNSTSTTYTQSNPCANSAEFPDEDSFLLTNSLVTQSTTWGASVPEPGTFALFLLGLFGLYWRLIRRRSPRHHTGAAATRCA